MTDGVMLDGTDPMAVLEVIDRLEVGPVEIEPRKITAPYRLFRLGEQASAELIYKYEEDVFDPDEAESQNLGSMLAAQVAINYGLFCKEIHFSGLYDPSDKAFLGAAFENTAREIYVKKFLEPNVFLKSGEARELGVHKQESFSRAELIFHGLETKPRLKPWEVLADQYSVLSSGGKDSLLSYGLLNELGYEVHPIFGNESGRHWFTALNAHRHFNANVPNTARVWINSDRVFAWMLRRLPFIRQDFSNIRSDEYPIRLWTVAIFLFGALPILRKRQIGRLVIGNEFDTTAKTTFKGITHYDGLYDQSRFFDEFLSRYFARKAWGIQQFSILRPLSELLIQKTLAIRYPELQQHQVSCHATHDEGGRIKPCGRCEKCRRIVGMLTAVDVDPSRCGYSEKQISTCLQDLTVKGIHQEKGGVQHLFSLLTEKGSINPSPGAKKLLVRHPEIAALRFDRERSPTANIPSELREPIYRILFEYSQGAVVRKGRQWLPFDPFSPESLTPPYPFEVPQVRRRENNQNGDSYLLGRLTWPEAQQRLKAIDIALLPVGAIEQHGPHLPLDTDAFDAEHLAREVALACSDPKPIVLPLIPYGVSYHHDGFCGTLSISNDTLSKLVYEVGMGAARNGITKLVIVNGHGGNDPALNFAAQMINRDAHIFTCVDSGQTSDVDVYQLVETPNDVHAGEIETSTSLALRPELVKFAEAKRSVPRFSSEYLNFTSRRGVSWYAHTENLSPEGVLGDPTKASAEKGRRIWETMIGHMVVFVEDLKQLTLDELYQRRY
jgi:creatinine amidohydrolase/Fe(II)-dependent formamide hydrolase-like protein